MAEPVRGCADTGIHSGHTWNAVIRGRRGDTQKRWCPGRVKCVSCQKHVFTSTATQGQGGIWVCTGRCR